MKNLFRLVLCALVCLTLLPALAEEELTIVHATDMHFISPALSADSERFLTLVEQGDGKVTHYTPELMAAFTAEMLALQPDAVILSGDLTFNGAAQSHADLIALLTPLTEAGIRVLTLPGNHDDNTTAYGFRGPDYYFVPGLPPGTFGEAYAALGYADAIARDAASMSYVARISPGVWCLLVDANVNNVAGVIAEDTFIWIEQQLIRARQAGVTVIAVSHQPALIHNSLFTSGYVISNHARLQALYKAYGVTLNLCGHLHMQHIAEENGLVEIAASSLAVAPNQYGVLHIRDRQLQSYRMQPLDVSAWAAQTGQTDPNLLAFSAYAADFFNRTTYDQTAAMFTVSTLPLAEQEPMIDFAVRLNAEYFSGRRTLTADDPLWAMWQEHMPASFFTWYMGSILEEPPRDMTQYRFCGDAP